MAQTVKCLSAMQETRVRSLGWEDPLEKEMAAHSSILAWKLSWTEEPGRLLSTGSQRVGHDWATSLIKEYLSSRIAFREGNGTPLQHSCLENPMGGGAWWAAVHGVAGSRTRLSAFTFTFHFRALEREMATPTPVFLPGESQGWRSLLGCRLWGRTESDTT